MNNYECKDDLICVQDGTCSKPCSITPCDLDEGVCHSNEECKGGLICSSDMSCTGKNIITILYIPFLICISK